MNKTLIALLALGSISTSAFAFHPGDDEHLTNIGVGTTLTVLKDVNITPNNDQVALGDSCALFLKKTRDFDRVLAAGTELEILRTFKSARGGAFLLVNNKNIQSIYCLFINEAKPTIGAFKKDTQSIFEVKLADPVRI
jgi:hypothetical protein